jgi:hypothetical protein
MNEPSWQRTRPIKAWPHLQTRRPRRVQSMRWRLPSTRPAGAGSHHLTASKPRSSWALRSKAQARTGRPKGVQTIRANARPIRTASRFCDQPVSAGHPAAFFNHRRGICALVACRPQLIRDKMSQQGRAPAETAGGPGSVTSLCRSARMRLGAAVSRGGVERRQRAPPEVSQSLPISPGPAP